MEIEKSLRFDSLPLQIKVANSFALTGLYTIRDHGSQEIHVRCDMETDGGGL